LDEHPFAVAPALPLIAQQHREERLRLGGGLIRGGEAARGFGHGSSSKPSSWAIRSRARVSCLRSASALPPICAATLAQSWPWLRSSISCRSSADRRRWTSCNSSLAAT